MSVHSLLAKITETIEQGKRMIPINKTESINCFNIAIDSLNDLKRRNQDSFVAQRIDLLLLSANQSIQYANEYKPVVVQPKYPVYYPSKPIVNHPINPPPYNGQYNNYSSTSTNKENDPVKDKFNKVQNYINLSSSIIKTDSSQAKFLLVKAETLIDEISKEKLNEIRSNLLITYKDLIKKLKNDLPKTPPTKHRVIIDNNNNNKNPTRHYSLPPPHFIQINPSPSPSPSPPYPPYSPLQQQQQHHHQSQPINMLEYNKMLFDKANHHIEIGDTYLVNYPLEAKREYESAFELLKHIESNVGINNNDMELISKVNIKKNVLNDKMSVLKKMLEMNNVKVDNNPYSRPFQPINNKLIQTA